MPDSLVRTADTGAWGGWPRSSSHMGGFTGGCRTRRSCRATSPGGAHRWPVARRRWRSAGSGRCCIRPAGRRAPGGGPRSRAGPGGPGFQNRLPHVCSPSSAALEPSLGRVLLLAPWTQHARASGAHDLVEGRGSGGPSLAPGRGRGQRQPGAGTTGFTGQETAERRFAGEAEPTATVEPHRHEGQLAHQNFPDRLPSLHRLTAEQRPDIPCASIRPKRTTSRPLYRRWWRHSLRPRCGFLCLVGPPPGAESREKMDSPRY